MVAIYDVLKASKGIHVDDTFAELWGRKRSNAYTVETYTGTLPATLKTVEGYLESYKIYGNTVQAGTPTPENPIEPSGCGERTVNLYNINAKDINNGYVGNAQLVQNGTTIAWSSAEISEYIPISGDMAYTFNGIGSYNSPCYALYDENKQLISAYRYSGASIISFTSPSNARYFRFTHIKIYTEAMLVEGTYTSSTMPEYESYGYKLPLTSAGQNVDIYLGDGQTTRRIKKLAFDGTENWAYQSAYTRFTLNLQDMVFLSIRLTPIICTHYITVDDGRSITDVPNNTIYVGGSSVLPQLAIKTDGYATVAELKAYLAQQYTNGTPVTIWYVLAEPETGIVNEPLMKIGDYADTIDSTQSTVQIPTFVGNTIIDYDGTPKPDKVDLTYRKRKGQ